MRGIGIEILLSSDFHYEKLIAEIYYDGKFVALLNQDSGINNLKIEFPSTDSFERAILRKIDLALFEEGVKLAKQRLRG